MTDQHAAPLVFQKIAIVQGELAKSGIAKTGKNKEQGYAFRGIDQIYDALAPLLSANGLTIIPRMIDRERIEGQTRNGSPLFRVTVTAEFDFVAAEDGSKVTARTYGEAMDSADKATNKAMSAALKYAALMTFTIPTEGDNDADANTPEPASEQQMVITKMISLCEAIGGGESQKVCKAYKIKDFRELTQRQATAVLARLEEKLAEKENAAKAAQGGGEFDNIDDKIVPF